MAIFGVKFGETGRLEYDKGMALNFKNPHDIVTDSYDDNDG